MTGSEFGWITFVFETICSGDCELYFMMVCALIVCVWSREVVIRWLILPARQNSHVCHSSLLQCSADCCSVIQPMFSPSNCRMWTGRAPRWWSPGKAPRGNSRTLTAWPGTPLSHIRGPSRGPTMLRTYVNSHTFHLNPSVSICLYPCPVCL